MAVNFPDSPSLNATITVDGKTWKWNGTVWEVTVAAVEPLVTIVDADGDTKMQLEAYADEDKIRFDTAGSERMIIDSSGNVGIGTTSPARTLDIGTGLENPAPALRFTDIDEFLSIGETVGYIEFYSEDLNASAGVGSVIAARGATSTGGHRLDFDTGEQGGTVSTRMTIDNTGKVGIGTTAPRVQLDLAAPAGGSDREAIRISADGGDGLTQGKVYMGLSPWNTGTYPHARIGAEETDLADYGASIVFQTRDADSDVAPTTKVTITEAGNVGIGTVSPQDTLHVDSAGANAARFRQTVAQTDTRIELRGNDGTTDRVGYVFFDPVENFVGFRNGNANVLGVNNQQRVGIGETSPSRKLHVNEYSSGGQTFPLAVTNGTPGGSGALDTEAGIWFTTNSSTTTQRGAYISAINTGGTSNGHDLIFAVSADASVPSEGMRLDQNKELIHHRSGAFCGGPTSWTSAYKNYWDTARTRGTFLTASNAGITVNRSGFYYVRYVQRSDGTGNPYAGIGESGNRTTLENRTTGIWTHDHGGSTYAHLESVYIGYLAANEVITAGAVDSTNAADLIFASNTYAGILYAIYLGE